VQLVSKISNLCGPDPPTSQTDGRHAIAIRAMHYSASRGKKFNHKLSAIQRYAYATYMCKNTPTTTN